MSGHVDEEARTAAKAASAAAAKRGERIVSMTSHRGSHGRTFTFGYEKVERVRKRATATTTEAPRSVTRGAAQGSLL